MRRTLSSWVAVRYDGTKARVVSAMARDLTEETIEAWARAAGGVPESVEVHVHRNWESAKQSYDGWAFRAEWPIEGEW